MLQGKTSFFTSKEFRLSRIRVNIFVPSLVRQTIAVMRKFNHVKIICQDRLWTITRHPQAYTGLTFCARRENHRGTLLGMTRFRDGLDDMPILGYGAKNATFCAIYDHFTKTGSGQTY